MAKSIFLLFCAILLCKANFPQNNLSQNCELRLKFQRVCNHYKPQPECRPPSQVDLCQRIKTTYNERKCPFYICVSLEGVFLNDVTFLCMRVTPCNSFMSIFGWLKYYCHGWLKLLNSKKRQNYRWPCGSGL